MSIFISDKVTQSQVDADIAAAVASLTIDDIALPAARIIGTPEENLDLPSWLDHAGSAGITNGGAITNNGDGTVNIAECDVTLRESVPVSSITRVGQTATITTTAAHGHMTGENVFVNGANQNEYNGFFNCVVTAPTIFTVTVSGSPASPATGTIFTTDEHSTLISCEVPAVTNFALTDNATNYIYAAYNNGTPQYEVLTAPTYIAGLARCLIWTVARFGTALCILDGRGMNVDQARKIHRRSNSVAPMQVESGGSVISATGTRNIAVTAGAFWSGVIRTAHYAFDTSASSTFYTAYNTNGTWTYTASQTAIDNTQWNDTTSGLVTATTDYYLAHWVYMMNNDPSFLLVVYGQAEYATIATARASTEPTRNAVLSGVAALIGRVIIKKGATAFLDIVSAFATQFPVPASAFTLDSVADVVAPTPAAGEFLSWNGSNWVNASIPTSGAGVGLDFYKTTPVITATSTGNIVQIGTLSATPVTTAEQTTTSAATAANVTAAFAARVLDTTLGRTSIPAGEWNFDIYASISSTAGTTTVTEQVYKVTPAASGTVTVTGTGTSRTATASAGAPFATTAIDASATNTTASYLQTPTGLYQISARTSDTVVTIITPSAYVNDSAVTYSVFKKLFGVTSSDFTQTAVSRISIQPTVQSAFTVAATDKLGTITFVTSTDNGRTVTIHYNGNANNSKLTAPVVALHNDLPGLQGGSAGQRNHLTDEELLIAQNAATKTVTQSGELVYAADSGSANAYAMTITPAIAAYAAGQLFRFKAGNANTGASTLAVSGLTAKAIKKLGVDLAAADITANDMVEVIYDGTSFQMLSQARKPVLSGQLQFPATQNASADANTLDDYEEGTWTPSVGGTATYAAQAGTYTVVGDLVRVQGFLSISNIGTGSTTTISGLPYASANLATIQMGYVSYFANLAVSVTWIGCHVVNNSTNIKFDHLTAAASSSTYEGAVLGNTDVIVNIVYRK